MTPRLIKYGNIVLTTTITHLTLYHLCLLLLVRLGGYIANLSDFYSYRLIGKLTAFVQFFCSFRSSSFVTNQWNLPLVGYVVFSAQLKEKVGSTLTKDAVLRINLNIDGAPITSRTHTHPSHSQTSRLLTSSLSLGVPVPRGTQCMWGA
jgi:hypothetical protein